TGWVDPLGLNTCPGADGCKPVAKVDEPSTKANVHKNEPEPPTTNEEEDYLFRGDRKHPDEIFKHGFKSKGESNDLYLHALNSNDPPSNFISTSPSRLTAADFATGYGTRGGYLYVLKSIPGHDVNLELGKMTPFSNEKEFAVHHKIHPEDILGMTPLKPDGSYVGHSIPNPNRK
ncbi:type IV secretion protein Rhs, partial [Pseudomonas sp. MAFF 212408]|nr:type IV secretion protein Rhs [Pseudomonas kitaguniensis]